MTKAEKKFTKNGINQITSKSKSHTGSTDGISTKFEFIQVSIPEGRKWRWWKRARISYLRFNRSNKQFKTDSHCRANTLYIHANHEMGVIACVSNYSRSIIVQHSMCVESLFGDSKNISKERRRCRKKWRKNILNDCCFQFHMKSHDCMIRNKKTKQTNIPNEKNTQILRKQKTNFIALNKHWLVI